jgi:hypothetical protein
LKLVLPALLVAGGLVVAPMMLPVLPIEKTDAYITAATLGLVKNPGDITYLFHGARGWENQAKGVAEVFHRLSPEEQADCIIFTGNYREAAALNFYGPAVGLPPACTLHQNYYFWGPPAKSGNLIIFVGIDQNTIERYIGGELQHAGMIQAQEMVVWGEQSVLVSICRKPRVSLKEVWPKLRERAFLN